MYYLGQGEKREQAEVGTWVNCEVMFLIFLMAWICISALPKRWWIGPYAFFGWRAMPFFPLCNWKAEAQRDPCFKGTDICNSKGSSWEFGFQTKFQHLALYCLSSLPTQTEITGWRRKLNPYLSHPPLQTHPAIPTKKDWNLEPVYSYWNCFQV